MAPDDAGEHKLAVNQVNQISYFQAQVGQAIVTPAPKSKMRQPVASSTQPLFHAQLGVHPGTERKPAGSEKSQLCPLCGSELRLQQGLYHCQGRCGARWLRQKAGHLIDIATLPFGVCACCRSPQALVSSDVGAICPASGCEYLVLLEGVIRRDIAAPDGLCQCCKPPMPLVWQEGALVCRSKPQNHYRREGNQVIWLGAQPAANLTTMLTAIDAALLQNSAQVAIYGVFAV